MSEIDSKRVTSTDPEIAYKQKTLERAIVKYQARLQKWVKTHGKDVSPPLVWTGLDWVWANRKDMRELRRAQSRKKKS